MADTEPSSSRVEGTRARTAPVPVSIHVRAFITWLAIFPLVALGMSVLTPLTLQWHSALRSLVLTLIVVPLAVYIAVPLLLSLYRRLRSRD